MLWIDHQRRDDPQAAVDARDRGLLLGDGLFDTSLVVNGCVAFLPDHLDRLERSCGRLDIPLDLPAVESAMRHAASEIAQGSMRLTITRGIAPRGIAIPEVQRPMLMIAGRSGGFSSMFQPLRLKLTPIRRNETSPAAQMKALGYLDAVLALREARAAGADESLFLNTSSHVACCGSGNLFVLRGRKLLTPPLSDGVLEGITRRRILALAPAAGLTAAEQSLTPRDLLHADAVFMTNSLRLIAPVAELDGRALAPAPVKVAAPVGALAEALLERITDECGAWDHPPPPRGPGPCDSGPCDSGQAGA